LGDKIKYEEVFHTTPEELKKASSRKTLMASLKVFSLLVLIYITYISMSSN